MNKLLHVLLCLIYFGRAADAQILINEYSAANLNTVTDNYGKHDDWVELYNAGTTVVDLQGWSLSDDDEEPGKWQFGSFAKIPAKGFMIVWCSGRNESTLGGQHSSFKLQQTKGKAEHLVLSDKNGLLISDLKVKKLQVGQSYGRKTDGGAEWGICTQPTPKTTNNNSNWYNAYAQRPDMSQIPGFYPAAISVTLTTEEPNATIRYTLDGTMPKPGSTLYNGPITVDKTQVLKAVTFSSDPLILPSFVEFNTYFINENYTLPVVSVAADDLLDLANGVKHLRPQGSLEYFGTDKDRKASVTGELNSHGQDSWVNAQRSLDWVSRDEMGDDSAIKEALFPTFTDRDEFQRIILRAAGDDNYPGGSGYTGPDGRPQSAHMRDAYTQNLAKRDKLNIDTRTGAKAIIYLNGRYWGVYDLREIPDDPDFTEYNYNQGKFDLQYIKTWGWTWVEFWDVDSSSTYPEWRNLWDFIMNNDMSVQSNFEKVKEELDYTSLVDYLLVNSFANASDWLNYNTGWWRGMNPEGEHRKWGYILWDLDATYAYYINYTGIPDTSATSPPCNVELITSSWSDPEGHVSLANKLRENAEFNQFWISRQADLMKTTFSCDNMLSYFDEVLASIEPEMPKHIARWGGTVAEWEKNVKKFRHFIERRCAYLPNGLKTCYNLTGPFSTTLRVVPEQAGSIKANTLTYASFPVETPIFGNFDLKLEATPDSGYVFDHWESINHTFQQPDNASAALFLTQSDTLTAVFKKTAVPVWEPSLPEANVQAFPTLLNTSLTIQFQLPEARKVSLRLLDVLGREVKSLELSSDKLQAGQYRFTSTFEGEMALTPGVYWLNYSDGASQKSIKLVKQ